jgi:hypothetical protein
MSYVNTSSHYAFSLGVGNDTGAQTFTGEISQVNMTDSLAVAFARAWLALPWPVGANPTASITKHDASDTISQVDLSIGAFS